jgi:hypothetical protein
MLISLLAGSHTREGGMSVMSWASDRSASGGAAIAYKTAFHRGTSELLSCVGRFRRLTVA